MSSSRLTETRDRVRSFGGYNTNPQDVMSTESLVNLVTATPQGPHKLALILSQEAKQLLAMDRYERRALSRRKFAIRAFDAARRQAASARE